jgi:hypothetical protein
LLSAFAVPLIEVVDWIVARAKVSDEPVTFEALMGRS